MGAPPGEPWAAVAETHSGAVFFVGDRAYKVKKPLDLGFVDYRTVQQRAAACRGELSLNSRLAPDVYLGLAELRLAGQPPEPVLVMRRMPAERRLTTWVVQGRAGLPRHLREVARTLAAFHEECQVHDGPASPGTPDAVRALWDREIAGFIEVLGTPDSAAAERLDRTRNLSGRYLSGRRPLFEQRLREGRIRDGHGDLLADDVFLLDDGPRILDCLEFDERLRVGDVLLDVAFLAMDLERLGDPDAARLLLDDYREFSAETHPQSLADFYIGYRAHVRAKVARIRARQGDPAAAGQAEGLEALCLRRLTRATVALVLVGGLPGAGKTSLAGALADCRAAVVLSSDVVRKQAAGLPQEPAGGTPYAEGRYAPAVTAETYRTLLHRAGVTLARGESVVLDASWHDPSWRGEARAVAHRTGAVLVELACTAPDDVAEARLAARTRGASDADRAVRHAMAKEFAPWPEAVPVPTGAGLASAATAADRAVTAAIDRAARSPV